MAYTLKNMMLVAETERAVLLCPFGVLVWPLSSKSEFPQSAKRVLGEDPWKVWLPKRGITISRGLVRCDVTIQDWLYAKPTVQKWCNAMSAFSKEVVVAEELQASSGQAKVGEETSRYVSMVMKNERTGEVFNALVEATGMAAKLTSKPKQKASEAHQAPTHVDDDFANIDLS